MSYEKTELKPCPFCGGKAELKSSVQCLGHGEYIKEHYVMCTECFAHGRTESEYGMEADECIAKCKEAWNRIVNNEWISVRDRLPEESGEYLTYHGGFDGGYYMLLNYSAKHKLFNVRDESKDTSKAILSVTHWMLRPEPPETKLSDNEKIEQIEKTEAPKRLIYESYSPHDCESWYSCPYCNKKIGSWSLPTSYAVDNGEKMYCPYCKKEVKYPY